jgi:hypothetical protein
VYLNPFSYAAEKFSAARRGLMAPNPSGEAASFAGAFHECWLGLKDIDRQLLDDNARRWIGVIERTMDTSGISDPRERGTWTIKAEALSEIQMHDFSSAVDELAEWFRRFESSAN